MPSPFGLSLQHVQLSIPKDSETACREFYVSVLGLTEEPKPPVLAARGGLWLRSGKLQLHLCVEDDFRPAKKAHPAFVVEAFEKLAAHLEASGVPITWDENVPGTRRFYAHDNVGNRLEFIEG